jgi:hypothetical protein
MQCTRENQLFHRFQAQRHAFADAHDRQEHSSSRAIVGVGLQPSHTLSSLLGQAANDMHMRSPGDRLFTIRAADSSGQRSRAGVLIDRMYATRGYRTNGLPSESSSPNRITLTACERDEVMGTITVNFDSPGGLFVDQLFREEVDALRRAGRTVCEFTKLAMDGMVRSRRVLASLFHVAYIYARRLHRMHDLLIEVNPRHVRYYERMLGFVQRSGERLNPRVDAPAVLLALDLAHAESKIDKFGGLGDATADEKSLYPHFFSAPEEAGIVRRLKLG